MMNSMFSSPCNSRVQFRSGFFAVAVMCLLSSCAGSGSGPQISPPEAEQKSVDESPDFRSGTFCARVHYANPATGHEQDYHLLVDTKDNAVVNIHWADAGNLDTDHFTAAALGEGQTASFTSDAGVNFTVHLLGDPDDCKPYFRDRVRCLARTKSGDQCKRMTDRQSGYCWQHRKK
jgi:hypothetical protein